MGFKFERLSVLVVEDTTPMRKLVCSVLETLGIGNVSTAENGEEAFSLFCKSNPDIVITDWHMEPIDGIKLIQMIRTHKTSQNKTVPIIMMSGYSAMPRVTKARDYGTTEFLVKPFSANDLARRIAHVINQPRDFIKTNKFFGPDRRRIEVGGYNGPFRRSDDGHAL